MAVDFGGLNLGFLFFFINKVVSKGSGSSVVTVQ